MIELFSVVYRILIVQVIELNILEYLLIVKDLSKALLLADKDFKSKYGITKPSKNDCGIVFLCSSGVRSDMAYKIAKGLGYKW